MKLPIDRDLALIVAFASTGVLAGACDRDTPCGQVENQGKYNLKFTTEFQSLDCPRSRCPTLCDVWNYKGGNKVIHPPVRIRCKPENLAPGEKYGGGSISVDAFTFVDRQYKVIFEEGSSKIIPKDGWTRIAGNQQATCTDNSVIGMPVCWIKETDES